MMGIRVGTHFYPERLSTLYPPVSGTLGCGGYLENNEKGGLRPVMWS